MRIIISILLNALSFYIGSLLLDGVVLDGLFAAILSGVILGVANAIVKPVLTFITLPITILTLGLFMLVINALIVLLVDALVAGFEVDGFWWALVLGIILSLLNLVYAMFTKD